MQKDRVKWSESGYPGPAYDRPAMIERTLENPWWIHFGAGNIFRAFPARVADELLDAGVLDRGALVVEGFDEELLEKAYEPYDNCSIAVTLRADGSMEKRIVGSVAGTFNITKEKQPESCQAEVWEHLADIMEKPSVQMLTFTITEKGYAWKNGTGELYPAVKSDCQAGPEAGIRGLDSYMGKVTALLYRRFLAGGAPIALVSMDNCSENGKKLSEAVCFYADTWVENGLAEKGFSAWLRDETKVAFPWTMIDKITPRPDEKVREKLLQDGLADMELIVTRKNTYTAPFVNAEECEYLVIEDSFPAGRPALERAKGGIYFADRDTVKKAERMKVSTCLNPLHTALAVFGCLFGYERIYEEMEDAELTALVHRLGYQEGMPVVTDPGILKPEDFLREVLEKRLPNQFLPDSPWRIATDTSQKLAVRFGETVKEYQKTGISLERLVTVPLVYAGWLRYLCGTDDRGEACEVSPDPKLAELAGFRERLRQLLAEQNEAEDRKRELRELCRPVFSRQDIFGLDVARTVLFEKAVADLAEMTEGQGAVRSLLIKKTREWRDDQ